MCKSLIVIVPALSVRQPLCPYQLVVSPARIHQQALARPAMQTFFKSQAESVKRVHRGPNTGGCVRQRVTLFLAI